MLRLTLLLACLTLLGCDRGSGSGDAPELSGTWESLVGGDSLRLMVNEGDGTVTGVADWGGDQYTIEGTHTHPDVSLALRGPFTQTRVVSVEGSFTDSATVEGTLATSGFPDQAVTFRRAPEAAP